LNLDKKSQNTEKVTRTGIVICARASHNEDI